MYEQFATENLHLCVLRSTLQHGINALPPDEQDGKGRISIILWGLADNVIEEEGSPPLLGADGQGPHAKKRQKNNRNRNRNNGNNNNGNNNNGNGNGNGNNSNQRGNRR